MCYRDKYPWNDTITWEGIGDMVHVLSTFICEMVHVISTSICEMVYFISTSICEMVQFIHTSICKMVQVISTSIHDTPGMVQNTIRGEVHTGVFLCLIRCQLVTGRNLFSLSTQKQN